MTACPTFGSWEEFHAYRFEEPMWRPLVYEVLDRHGIARPARLAMTSSVHVVAIAGPVVVKLYQPLSDGDSWAVETGALRLLGRHGLPVPALQRPKCCRGATYLGASAGPSAWRHWSELPDPVCVSINDE